MNFEFPTMLNVFLGTQEGNFRRLLSNKNANALFETSEERSAPYCMVRQYLKMTNDKGFCPFTKMLELVNAYFIQIINTLPTEYELYAIAQYQEEMTERLVQLHDLKEMMSIPPITTVVAFAHPEARKRSFLELLEKVRINIRTSMIPRKRAVAIAHPEHPLGGNAHGTDKSERKDEPLFISPIPLMDMRYLHPMDRKFGYEGYDLFLFNQLYPPR
ncbi:MAG: hypothetical protein HOJ16_04795 [Candidatus Peribacter sp.]|jgi:hypothetical protein|nr:hypothetical protein [Candidatus Peribacter sp.]